MIWGQALNIGLWRGVIESSGDFPIHHLECDFNGLRPFVLVPLTTEVQRGVKASVGRAIGGVDWMSLKDLRELKILEPLEFSLFEPKDPAAD